ncbi:DUF4139 domain-containing protein [Amycolatopsis magusensis]|uniref:Uncharacterized protein (TIGR02231 family) n=1 Tax=Amycolatopsis magusensis TaxID=882444 RepID=A0ABS4Q316_9PSEU|nr:DUF4139 domain-containing protein [Amycolatopsis magusensis]MBP2186072.1 uncharacterized protein (TIGR02231 family) [Amycolatopsis magusensis]
MPTPVRAPIVAVTVYPQHARIVRRARAELGGDGRFAVGGLPRGLLPDSVRASGTGPASIVGVDVRPQYLARPTERELDELLERRRVARRKLDEVADAEAVETGRADLLNTLAQRSGRAFADALAAGTAQPSRVAEIGDALAAQLSDVLASRRELADRHARLAAELDAVDREVSLRQAAQAPDRTEVVIELEPAEGAGTAEVELELSYVVTDARWESGYDIRLDEDQVKLTWYGLVTQQTGEDWPECELTLSTARPAATVHVPEPEPWYLDRARPTALLRGNAAAGGHGGGYGGAMPEMAAAAPAAAPPMADLTAQVEQGAAAASYRPARPVGVPSDGGAHRTTITTLGLEAELSYVTAPVLAEEAYLRATVINGGEHTLRPGKASVFHDNEFVGTTRLDNWAPGEEVELALGVDDRIRVKRELRRRSATKTALTGTRRRELEYRITVTNHGPRTVPITVLDQAPVSRDEAIVVRDVRTSPEPEELSSLGEVTWRFDLAPAASAEAALSFRVDVSKGVELRGWRE